MLRQKYNAQSVQVALFTLKEITLTKISHFFCRDLKPENILLDTQGEMKNKRNNYYYVS